MRSIQLLAVSLFMVLSAATWAGGTPEKKTDAVVQAGEKCDHGVKKALCTRCNAKLEAVYKSKGDWCEDHKRAESQCALCNPKLEKEGVKP